MTRHRATLIMGLVAFSLFASTSASSAMWSTNATVAGRVESGTVAVTQTGATTFAVAYNMTTLAQTAPITITNTGTTSAPHILQLTGSGSATLAQGMLVRTWPTTAAGLCTAAAAVPAAATSSSLANVPAMTATLSPSGIAVYCIRTSITAAQQTSLASQSVTVSSTATSALGAWTAPSSIMTAVQSVIDTSPPSVPAPTARTLRTQTTLTWPASTDNVGTTLYEIFRGGTSIATTTATSYTQTGLNAGSSYSYTVRARDAAANFSAQSSALVVKTVVIQRNTRYLVSSSVAGRCLDGGGAGTTEGTSIVDWSCHGNPNQIWTFKESTADFFVVTADYTRLVWGVDATGTYARLFTANGLSSQEWQPVAVSPDTIQYVNRASGKCMQLGSVTGNDVNTTLATCAVIPQQTFTMSVR